MTSRPPQTLGAPIKPWRTTDNDSCLISQIFSLISLGRIMSSDAMPIRFISAGHVTAITNRKPVRQGQFPWSRMSLVWKVLAHNSSSMTIRNMAHNSSLRLARQEVSALLLAHNSSLGLARQEGS